MSNPVWALASAVFAVGLDFSIILAIIPVVADDLDETVVNVVLVASAYALATAFLAPVFGPLSDRSGRRRTMVVGLLIFSISAAVCAVAPDLAILLVARAVNGLGAAIVLPAAFAYAGDLPDLATRSRAMGIVASAFPMAALLGLPIGALITIIGGWRAAFAFVAVLGLVAFTVIYSRVAVDPPRTGRRLGYVTSYRSVLADPGALRLLAVTFVWRLAPAALFGFFAEYIHVTHDVPADRAGLFLVGVGAMGVVSALLSGRVMAVIGARRTIFVATSAGITAAALLPLADGSLLATALLMALWAGGTWFGMPAINSVVADHSEHLRGTLLAFNLSAISMAALVAPVAGGFVVANAGFDIAFWVGALVGTTALITAFVVLPRPTAAGARRAAAG